MLAREKINCEVVILPFQTTEDHVIGNLTEFRGSCDQLKIDTRRDMTAVAFMKHIQIYTVHLTQRSYFE